MLGRSAGIRGKASCANSTCALQLPHRRTGRKLHEDVAAVVLDIDWGHKSPGSHQPMPRPRSRSGWATARALCSFERQRRYACAAAKDTIQPTSSRWSVHHTVSTSA